MTVKPGDIVVGDRDGVVVVSAERAEEVLAASETREAKEETMRAELNAGKTTVELLGLEPLLKKVGAN